MIRVKVLKEYISNGQAIKHEAGDILEWTSIGNFQQMLIDNDFVEIIKEEKAQPISHRFTPCIGDRYFSFDMNGKIDGYDWYDDQIDRDFYNSGDCFKTEEQAKKAFAATKNLMKYFHCLIASGLYE